MKKFILVISALLLLVVSAAALTPKQMDGRACHGLFGPVKRVTYDSGYVAYFSNTGQFLGWDSQYIKYKTATSYVKHGSSVYNVRYTATTRTDQQPTGEKFKTVYKFDTKGRIVEMFSNEDFYNQSYRYYYKGNSKYPYRETFGGGEGGEVSDNDLQYEYLEFDSHGNWTKRSYKGIGLIEDHDELEVGNVSGIETRTITYY